MNTKRILFSVLVVLFLGFGSRVSAQFQGQIQMKTYSNDKKGNVHESLVNMYVTKDRIMIKGEDKVNFNSDIGAEGLLIRNDKKDFVVMVGENRGLQVTKKGIEDLIQMFLSWGEESSASTDSIQVDKPIYDFTDRTRTILGYECAEMIIKDDEKDGNYLTIWLTPGIDINWGMLAEPWKNLPKDIDREVNGMPQEIFFRGQNFPMLVEAYKDGERYTVMEVTKVEKSNIAKAMVQVPSGVTLISAQEYIIGAMMN